MGRPKGTPKTGGRAKGSPNRNKTELADKARELGVDPFTILLLYAKGDADTLGYTFIPLELRLKAASEASKYLYPQKKAVEHSGEGGGPIEATIKMVVEDYRDGFDGKV